MRGRRTSLYPTLAALLAVALLGPAAPAVMGQDEPVAGLTATVDLHGGALPVDLPLEAVDGLGFTFFDPEDPRVVVQVINGCSLNDRFWVVAANLAPTSATLVLRAGEGALERTFELPARQSGEPVDPEVSLTALPICEAFEAFGGGITPLTGTARFSGVGPRCDDDVRSVSLIPRTQGTTFREVRFDEDPGLRVTSEAPVTAIDDDGSTRRLMLFAESRLPGRIEGVSFSGPERLLPARSVLAERLSAIRDGRVRRAYEAAVNGGTPQPLIDELGLRRVRCVHHISLEFADDDARDRLFLAGWLKEDPEVIDTGEGGGGGGSSDRGEAADDGATDADGRFIVEVIDAEGRLGEIPPVAGPSQRASSVRSWTFQDQESLAQIIDACDLSGSFWGVIGSMTEEGYEAIFLDLEAGGSRSYQVQRALGGSLSPAIVDPMAFDACG